MMLWCDGVVRWWWLGAKAEELKIKEVDTWRVITNPSRKLQNNIFNVKNEIYKPINHFLLYNHPSANSALYLAANTPAKSTGVATNQVSSLLP